VSTALPVESVGSVAPEAIAVVSGKQILDCPKGLYIPPDALEIFLETFEGPLDLLLYLIRKQDLDILNIPIAEITKQYLEYITVMTALRLELAAEYLLMAAILAEIKSRLLLPISGSVESDEECDPRAELIRRLQEYEQFKKAAEALDALPQVNRDVFICQAKPPERAAEPVLIPIAMTDLLTVMRDIMQRNAHFAHHQIHKEPLSIRARMTHILEQLQRIEAGAFVEWSTFFEPDQGKMGIVVSLIAILELCREFLIELVQNKTFAPIYVRRIV
jgi:segregation and condensation protein A